MLAKNIVDIHIYFSKYIWSNHEYFSLYLNPLYILQDTKSGFAIVLFILHMQNAIDGARCSVPNCFFITLLLVAEYF
jgi:hypothetical protein